MLYLCNIITICQLFLCTKKGQIFFSAFSRKTFHYEKFAAFVSVTCERIEAETETEAPSSHLMALYSEQNTTYALSRPRNTAEATLLLSVLLSFLQKEDTRYGSRSDFCQKVVWKMQKKSFQIFLPPLPNYFFYFFFVIFCYFSSDYRLKGSFLKNIGLVKKSISCSA